MASRISLGDLIFAFFRIPRALQMRSEERRHRKLMRKAPRFAIDALPENTFGKLVGIARPLERRLLEAPLSGRLCVYYEAHVDVTSGGTLLRTLASEQEGLAFVLEDAARDDDTARDDTARDDDIARDDDSGRTVRRGDRQAHVVVDPTDAFMSTGIDHVSTSTFYIASERQLALLKRLQIGLPPSSKQTQFGDGLRYREAIIEADERIAVFGAGVRELDRSAAAVAASDAMYRGEGASTRLRMSGTRTYPLFISDDPRALT